MVCAGADLKGGCRGWVPTLPEMTCGFLTQLVFYKICRHVWYVLSAVHIMLLPSQKPSSSYSLSKFVYVTSQLRHSLVVHPFLRKILDRSLLCATHMLSVPYCSAHRIQEMIESKRRTWFIVCYRTSIQNIPFVWLYCQVCCIALCVL